MKILKFKSSKPGVISQIMGDVEMAIRLLELLEEELEFRLFVESNPGMAGELPLGDSAFNLLLALVGIPDFVSYHEEYGYITEPYDMLAIEDKGIKLVSINYQEMFMSIPEKTGNTQIYTDKAKADSGYFKRKKDMSDEIEKFIYFLIDEKKKIDKNLYKGNEAERLNARRKFAERVRRATEGGEDSNGES